ncbi:hypothetical protein UlMin_036496 [Ulmus minor]
MNAVANDYYEVLGLLPKASPEEIKKAYYNCMKSCHPNLSGNDPETTNFCMFINEDRNLKSTHGYALTAIIPLLDDSCPKDLAFIDEFSCIGCKNCANVAPDVFSIEKDFEKARVYNQYGDLELVQQAIESCTTHSLSLLKSQNCVRMRFSSRFSCSVFHRQSKLLLKFILFDWIPTDGANVWTEIETNIKFFYSKDDVISLFVSNNEIGFSEENMKSLCSIGRSTKKGIK